MPFEKFAYTVIDPNADRHDSGPSVMERMAGKGLYCRPADNKRTGPFGYYGGWDVMRQRLLGDVQGRPMIACLDTCTDSIRTIPTLQHDPDNAEDMEKSPNDHAADEWRYACMSRPWVKQELPKIGEEGFKDYAQHELKTDRDFWVTL